MKSSIRVGVVVIAAAAALAASLLSTAWSQPSSQFRANPVFQPIGVSASGSGSTVWFHDPSTGRAMACQTVSTSGAGLSGIQCATTKLPDNP